MLLRKRIVKILYILVLFLLCAISSVPQVAFAQTESLYLGGFPAGFTLNTTTVEVVGLCDILTENGLCSPARDSGIQVGDVIDKINGENVTKSGDINTYLSRDYKKYEITIIRGSDVKQFEITPAKELSSGAKKLGALVKDSINGVGTITYINKNDNSFAALGHPVTDNSGNYMEINGGTVYGCLIYDVKRGVRGTPGELRGAFENNNIIGRAQTNSISGIYGTISADFDTKDLVEVERGKLSDVKIGKACIYTTIYGNEIQKYDISIVKVDKTCKDNRNFVVKIDDKTLLDKTGGIVQGMSGSPIVQNGKLIGAITHVFVNDPERGYGIAIDKMLCS
jgi:stage IV sporulation protein B